MSKTKVRFAEFFSRFRRDRSATIGLLIIIVITFICLLAPLLAPYDPRDMRFSYLQPPSLDHPLGTDTLGRDVLSRIIWGGRQTMYIGFGASLLAALIGVAVGAYSAYRGGILDNLMMRITDFTMVIPSFFFYILIFASFRSYDPTIVFSVMALLMWPTMCRVVRSEFLSLKERDFVKASRALGTSDTRIIFREILPNAMGSIIVVLTMNIGYAIIWSSALQFIGIGNPAAIDWAATLNAGRSVMRSGWWLSVFPGLMIFVTVLAFNLIGDGLRDALDPRLRGT